MGVTTRDSRRYNRQGDSSRRKILAATLRIAAQEGHRAATIARITQETGVSSSSIFWHFRNKQELLTTALEDGHEELLLHAPAWDVESCHSVDCDGLLERLMWWQREAEATLYFRVGMTLVLEGDPADATFMERFRSYRQSHHEQIRTWWEQEISQAGQVEFDIAQRAKIMASFTVAALDGSYISATLGTELSVATATLLCKGLLAMAHAPGPREVTEIEPATLRLVEDNALAGRDILIRAASAVMAKHGFHGATIAKICTEAGLPASSLYWQFKDKDSLVAAVISEGYASRHGSSLAVTLPAASDDWAVDFAHSLAHHLAWTEVYPQASRLGQLLALQQNSAEVQGRVAFTNRRVEFARKVALWLEQVALVSEGDKAAADHFAAMTVVMIDGVFIAGRLDQSLGTAGEIAGWVTLLLENALADS